MRIRETPGGTNAKAGRIVNQCGATEVNNALLLFSLSYKKFAACGRDRYA
jgi:hypothetical protein